MASNIRKKFGNVTGEEEAAADNELDECSKKMKKNKRNKKKKRSTEGRKSAKEKKKQIKSKAGTSGGRVSIWGPPSGKSNCIDYFVRRPRGVKKE